MRQILLLLGSAMLLLAAAPSANAYIHDYCGYLTPPYSRCPDSYPSSSVTHSNHDQNRARYPGTGGVRVCERIEYGYGGALLSRECGTSTGNWITSGWSSFGFSTAFVGNDSANNHTVDGRSDYH